LGLIGFILALFVLAMLAYLLKDYRGVPYNASLAIVWLYVCIATFVLGIMYFGQFMAPMRGDFGWLEGLRLILKSYTYTAEQFLNDPGGKLKKKKSGIKGGDEIPSGLYTLGAGYVQSYQVLSLTKGAGFVRAADPRFVRLYKKERIRQVVDLRTQLRTQEVRFNTRDGIPLKTIVTVIFFVKRNLEDHLEGTLYPFDRDAIFRLSYLDTVDVHGKEWKWTEQLAPRAAALLAEELSQYNLDGLIHIPATAVSPLLEISNRVLSVMQREFDAKGIKVLVAKGGVMELPPDVQKQNVHTWQADWKSKINVEEASSQAEVIRRMKQARARAQVKIIETIIQNLEAMRQESEVDAQQVIILRLIDALEEAMAADVPGAVPQQIMASLLADTSAQMRVRVDDKVALPAGNSEPDDEEDDIAEERPS
jgi:hypothetical protein